MFKVSKFILFPNTKDEPKVSDENFAKMVMSIDYMRIVKDMKVNIHQLVVLRVVFKFFLGR